ncbi:epi-neemfruitin B 7-O-acetyltransferse L7AT-like [Henckelia pumila]|uniref:epi-neemfruitin B 7-O-acetyltransferse L7AT-like n=1 Tax=Henckelia pumila TaxID=405737 RepID=UPI003C6E0FDE
MEVEIISREKVKPSSPTPHHLKIYKFSLLDQIIPPTFFPAVLYFLPESDSYASQKVHILKESLSLNLTRFYPFAGIINDDLSVCCNDEGIPFFEAKVRGNLQDFLSRPDLLAITKFLPIEFSFDTAKPGDHVSAIQMNCFECGGMAISIVVAHNVADGMTVSAFFRGWAAAARSTGEEIYPKFIGRDLFPSVDAMEKESKLFCHDFFKFLRLGKYVTRRYLFDASVIAKLKARSASSDASTMAYPTSIEVISAFIWKCYMKVFADKSDLDKPFILTHPVNLRRRADPALPDDSFGNFLWLTAAQCISPADTSLKDLASEVRRAIRNIDHRFVKVLQNNGYYENLEETRKGLPEGANCLAFSSWCKFGLYGVDFGWGKPIWISSFVSGNSESMLANSVTLMDTRFGDGIEAWVILDEKHVVAFEENEDLQNYVLINHSPLQFGKKI